MVGSGSTSVKRWGVCIYIYIYLYLYLYLYLYIYIYLYVYTPRLLDLFYSLNKLTNNGRVWQHEREAVGRPYVVESLRAALPERGGGGGCEPTWKICAAKKKIPILDSGWPIFWIPVRESQGIQGVHRWRSPNESRIHWIRGGQCIPNPGLPT